MNFLDFIDPAYSLAGFGVGVLVGMTGVGGGVSYDASSYIDVRN